MNTTRPRETNQSVFAYSRRRPRNDPRVSPAREPPHAPAAMAGVTWSPGAAPLRPARVAGCMEVAWPKQACPRYCLCSNPVAWCGSCSFLPQAAEIPGSSLFFTNQYNFQKDLEARHGLAILYFAKVRTLLKNNWYLLSPITSCKKGHFNTKDKNFRIKDSSSQERAVGSFTLM